MRKESVLDNRLRTGEGGARGHALVLANRLPFPLDDGWKVRTFHVIRGVASRFRVTLIVFHPTADADVTASAQEALGPDVRLEGIEPPRGYTTGNLLRGLVTRHPVHVWNQESAALRRRVREVVQSDPVDVAIIESTFMARYLDLIPRAVPRVVDTHNIDSVTFARYVTSLPAGPRRWYAAATVRRLAALERATYRAVDAVWVCSDLEREMASRQTPAGRVWTVPNGVDTTFFGPGAGPSDPRSLLFFGRLDYFPNVDGLGFFVNDVLPLVLAACPDASLDVVGAGANREVKALLANAPGTRLIGRVDDLRAALDASGIVVVPLRVGGGTRLKVLEAMSMARPVVSTRIGAEGIAVRDGEHLLLADSPKAFADAILRLIADPDLAARLGRNGRRLVQESYDWTGVGQTVAASLDRVTRAGTSS